MLGAQSGMTSHATLWEPPQFKKLISGSQADALGNLRGPYRPLRTAPLAAPLSAPCLAAWSAWQAWLIALPNTDRARKENAGRRSGPPDRKKKTGKVSHAGGSRCNCRCTDHEPTNPRNHLPTCPPAISPVKKFGPRNN